MVEISWKPLLVIFLTSMLFSSFLMVRGEDVREFTVLILYDGSVKESRVAKNMVKWLYSVMWKLPVEVWGIKGDVRDLGKYSMVFFLDSINGGGLREEYIDAIKSHDSEVVYVFAGLSPNSGEVAELVGCESPRYMEGGRCTVSDDILTRGLPPEFQIRRGEGISSKPTDGVSIIGTSDGRSLLVRKGNNVWIGFTALLYGGLSRQPYLIKVLRNILGLSWCRGLRLEIPYRFTAIRMDDFPFSTESWFFHWDYFTPEEYRRFFNMLEKYDAHVDLLIIPFNVSRDTGEWVSYWDVFPDEIMVFKEYYESGRIGLGLHGATHVTPYEEFFVNCSSLEPVKLTEAIRFEFGFDPHTETEIPWELQEEHITRGKNEIDKWFNFEVKLFTPPWHVWNNATELILSDLGFKYFSAYTNFDTGWVGQPPSLTGCRTPGGMICVPMTHGWEVTHRSEEEMMKALNSYYLNGIPVVFLTHGRNWTFRNYSEVFTISGFEESLKKLNKLFHPHYARIDEIGDFLLNWWDLRLSIESPEKGKITLTIDAPTKMEASLIPPADTESIKLNGEEMEVDGKILLNLRDGENVVEIVFKEESPEMMPPQYVILIVAVIAITLVVYWMWGKKAPSKPSLSQKENPK